MSGNLHPACTEARNEPRLIFVLALSLWRPPSWSCPSRSLPQRGSTFECVISNLQLCFLSLHCCCFHHLLLSLLLMLLSHTALDTWTLNHCLSDSAYTTITYKKVVRFPTFWDYLDFAIVGKVSQSDHNFGHCSSQGLLDRLLLPLGDPGEAWQQVHQVRSEPRMTR